MKVVQTTDHPRPGHEHSVITRKLCEYSGRIKRCRMNNNAASLIEIPANREKSEKSTGPEEIMSTEKASWDVESDPRGP
jgi:hypothetical protein